MPYCPECLAQYCSGVEVCTACRVELAEGEPEARAALSWSDTEVVRLCQVADPAEAEVIKAVLAEAGIQSLVRDCGPLTGQLIHIADGVTHDYAIIYVTKNRLDDARQVLERARSTPVQWPKGMEPDESSDDAEDA